MRVLLSTIGSRGEAQPVLALAVRLQDLGHEAVVCAPPDFQKWGESLGVEYVPVGPWLQNTGKPEAARIPTAEERQAMIDGTVAEQFGKVVPAAGGCDAVVGGGALAIAAHSAAEHERVPYVYAAFAPITLPSPHHAPPAFGMLGRRPDGHEPDITTLWREERERWNTMWRRPLNVQRADLGLSPVDEVRPHLFTAQPWLAADPALAPWPGGAGLEVFQTGAWLLTDDRPLDPAVEEFLAAGSAPIYCGFGSGRAPQGIAAAAISAARSLGRRLILAAGWAGLDLSEPDCLVIGEVNQQALFPHLAAVIHHGGAGTTTTAAAAGVPQVIVPQAFDQHYYAARVTDLGIGTALTDTPAQLLGEALATALTEGTARQARSVAATIDTSGALHAAQALLDLS
ncbi:glycosyltransferase [Actinomadura napierensis]